MHGYQRVRNLMNEDLLFRLEVGHLQEQLSQRLR